MQPDSGPKYETQRTQRQKEQIALIRRQFSGIGSGTGQYCMWLEDELLDLRRRHEQLVEAVEELGPHLAVAVLSQVKERTHE